MRKKLEKCLLEFLNEADSVSKKYTPKQRITEKYFKVNEGWGSRYQNIIRWDLDYTNEFKLAVESIPSIEACLDILVEVVASIKMASNDMQQNPEEVKKKNRSWKKHELFHVFIDYKMCQQKGIGIVDYVKYKINELLSKTLYIKYRALLLGLDAKKNPPVIRINNFEIRELSIEEKLEMMNNVGAGLSFSVKVDPFSIAVGYRDNWPSSMWLVGKVEITQPFERTSLIFRRPEEVILKVEQEIENTLRTLRLYKSIDAGIRDYYVSISFNPQYNNLPKWICDRYKYGDFGILEKTSPNSFSPTGYQNFNYDLQQTDEAGIKSTYNILSEYYKKPIDQISNSLFYFSNSFEQNRFHYVFSDLLVSLECLINDPNDIKEWNKESVLQAIEKVKTKIENSEGTPTHKNISRKLFFT